MTNIQVEGWSWGADTFLVWEMPSGQTCTYTGTQIALSSAVNGVTLCEGAKLGIGGSVNMPAGIAPDNWCEIRLIREGHSEVAIANGYIYNNRAYWSAGTQSSWYTVEESGTYTLGFVYRKNGEYFGSVLQTDIPIAVLSMDENPSIVVQDATSYYTGFCDLLTGHLVTCNVGGSANSCSTGESCTFVMGSPTWATISVFISGGSPNGVEYTMRVEKFYGLAWHPVAEEIIGTLMPGGGSRYDITLVTPFNIEDCGILGTLYRMVIAHRTIQGTQMNYYTQLTTLHTKTQETQECPTCPEGSHCSGEITSFVCVPDESTLQCPTSCPTGYHCSGEITSYQCVQNSTSEKCPTSCPTGYHCSGAATAYQCIPNEAVTCDGFNRNGQFDVSCIFDEKNRSLIYIVIALAFAAWAIKR